MATAILIKQKLQYITRYTTNLPKLSTFHTQISSSSKLLSSTNSSTLLPTTFPEAQSPISFINNTSNLIPRTDSTSLLRKGSKSEFFVRKNAIAALVSRLLPYEYDPCVALAATGGRMGGSISSSPSSYSSPTSRSSSSGGSHGSSFSYAPIYINSGGGGGGPVPKWLVYAMWFTFIASIIGWMSQFIKPETSVIKLQVCLLGTARSLQKDLDQIAKAANTSTAEGLNNILRETVLALLRHPDCCISCYSSVDVKGNPEDGEKGFDQHSIEERGKLDEETLVNVNNIKRKMKSRKPQNSETPNEYIVITILVSAEGTHNLPGINSSSDLKEALQQLGSISSGKIRAVEVLWTPQEEDDTLLEDELLDKYPLLRQLEDGDYSQSQSLFETEQE